MKEASLITATVLFLSVVAGLFPQATWVDRVLLKDGTELYGLVFDQVPGESVKVETAERRVLTLESREIAGIEKVPADHPVRISYRDVVYLKDGVIFRGTIVRQMPDVSLTLETDNAMRITFQTNEIWKILKERNLIGAPVAEGREAKPESESEREKVIRIRLKLDSDRRRLEELQGQIGSPAGGDTLEEDLQRLKDEIADLEAEEKEVTSVEEVERYSEEHREIEALYKEVEKLFQELGELIEACGAGGEAADRRPEREGIAANFHPVHYLVTRTNVKVPSHRFLSAQPPPFFVSDRGEAAEALMLKSAKLLEDLEQQVERAAAKMPSAEELDATIKTEQSQLESRKTLQALLETGKWRRLPAQPQVLSLTGQLPEEVRASLYESYRRRDWLIGFGLNLIPMLNLGSWMQGDWAGALFGYLITVPMFVLGFPIYVLNSNPVFVRFGESFLTIPLPGENWQTWLGAGLMAAGYTYSLSRPFWYNARLNRYLAEALDVDPRVLRKLKRKAPDLSVAPPGLFLIPAANGDLAVGIKLLSLSY